MKKTVVAASSILGLSLAVAGCGAVSNNGQSSARASTVSAATTGASSDAAKLKQYQSDLAKYSHKPTFIANGPAFDAKKATKGKSIVSIPSASTIPFDQNIEVAMAEVAKQVGFNFKEWNNQGQLSQYVQGMNYAVSKHVNLIDLLGGPDPANLGPQVQQAQQAKIPVATSVLTGFDQAAPKGVKLNIPFQYREVGRLLAEWALVHSNGKAHVLVITDNQIRASVDEMEGVKDVLKQFPQSTAVYGDVLNTEWATKIQSIVQSQLTQHPDINYILPVFDSMSQFIIPGLDIVGKEGKVKIATFNGTPFVLDMIRQGKVEMDLGQSEDWMGRAIMDDEMRMLAGLPVARNVHIPVYVWTKANVAQAGVPAKDNQGYGTDYVKQFNKLWGLSK